MATFATHMRLTPNGRKSPLLNQGDITMVDKNRIDGAGKEIKGAAKEALGKVTGNVGKQAEGAVEKNVGKAQRKIGEAADKARH